MRIIVSVDNFLKNFHYTPNNIYINLTSRCNLMCRHCYGAFGEENFEKDFTFWKKIFDDIKDSGVIYVNLSGGEATFHKDFKKIINYLNFLELPFFLTTNGIFNDSIYKLLVESKMLMGIKISIDGITDHSYLYIRDPKGKQINIYKILIKNLEKLSKTDIFISAGTLLHRKNLNDLENFPFFLKRYNIKKWTLGPLLPKGRGHSEFDDIYDKNVQEVLYDKKLWKKLTKISKENNIEFNLADIKYFTNDGRIIFECGAATSFFVINYDGKCYPCPLLPYSIFQEKYAVNIEDKKICDVWNSLKFKQWRSQQIYGCSKKCQHSDDCFRCPIQLDIVEDTNVYSIIKQCYDD